MPSSDRFLEGRVALVTGAGRGGGEAVARALAAAGAKVCASDLNPDRADRVAGQIVETGGESFGWQTDIANKLQAGALIETLRDRYGGLDILVNAAHVSPQTPLLTLDEWEWRRTLDVNLSGAFFCAQLAARVMADEGGGTIILLRQSVAKATGAQEASQAGLPLLATALAAEVAGRGVAVHTLEADTPEETAKRVIQSLTAGH